MLTIGVLASALFLSSCSSGSRSGRGGGQGHGKRGGERFKQLDTDGDGRLSYQEFQRSPIAARSSDSRAAFSKVDTSGNGYLEKNELGAARPLKRRQ